jgi:predicted DNA-binding transcriptional regulator YafY
MMTQIGAAVQTGRKMRVIYLSNSGGLSKRTVQIISYTEHNIIAYCYLRREMRVFCIKNILALELAGYERMEASV